MHGCCRYVVAGAGHTVGAWEVSQAHGGPSKDAPLPSKLQRCGQVRVGKARGHGLDAVQSCIIFVVVLAGCFSWLLENARVQGSPHTARAPTHPYCQSEGHAG